MQFEGKKRLHRFYIGLIFIKNHQPHFWGEMLGKIGEDHASRLSILMEMIQVSTLRYTDDGRWSSTEISNSIKMLEKLFVIHFLMKLYAQKPLYQMIQHFERNILSP